MWSNSGFWKEVPLPTTIFPLYLPHRSKICERIYKHYKGCTFSLCVLGFCKVHRLVIPPPPPLPHQKKRRKIKKKISASAKASANLCWAKFRRSTKSAQALSSKNNQVIFTQFHLALDRSYYSPDDLEHHEEQTNE